MIRRATIEDLPNMIDLANEFYAASEFLQNFNSDTFCHNWTNFIQSGMGVVFILNDFDGILGAAKYPDFNSGEMIAMEFFWFVSKEKRGGGIALLRAFEQWAKCEGCTKVIMVHLMDSMPEKLERVYKAFNYKPAEVHYVKEI